MHDEVACAPETNKERAVGHADHIGFSERHEALVVNAATAIGLIVAAEGVPTSRVPDQCVIFLWPSVLAFFIQAGRGPDSRFDLIAPC